jgi:hypothetical protein
MELCFPVSQAWLRFRTNSSAKPKAIVMPVPLVESTTVTPGLGWLTD